MRCMDMYWHALVLKCDSLGAVGGAVQLLGVNTSAIFIDEDFDSNVAASSGGAVHFAGATTGATLSISNSKVNVRIINVHCAHGFISPRTPGPAFVSCCNR